MPCLFWFLILLVLLPDLAAHSLPFALLDCTLDLLPCDYLVSLFAGPGTKPSPQEKDGKQLKLKAIVYKRADDNAYSMPSVQVSFCGGD